ncbi:CACTA en-spm transposon protein [Cucumis melo var. makuwa]|uniref:CACTA en-spm transposon protein n=1 Tax=Cucumis melo var. makuwa TaxID=1194695 RepID=A0A5D3D2K3_CUCMM|nr:CACTA en-spm transposon protein [Cucumis melo var. makuwa]
MRYVATNRWIPMTIAPGTEKPIFLHIVRFSQEICVCARKTFAIRCARKTFAIRFLKWVNVSKNTSRSSRATSRFVEHQKLTTFKDFWGYCYKHFEKYCDPEEARASPPDLLVGHNEYLHFLCDHYMSRAFQSNHRRTRLLDRSNLIIIVTSQSRFYNDSTSSLSKEGSQSIVWSCSIKHTFETGRSCPRLRRLRMSYPTHTSAFICPL